MKFLLPAVIFLWRFAKTRCLFSLARVEQRLPIISSSLNSRKRCKCRQVLQNPHSPWLPELWNVTLQGIEGECRVSQWRVRKCKRIVKTWPVSCFLPQLDTDPHRALAAGLAAPSAAAIRAHHGGLRPAPLRVRRSCGQHAAQRAPLLWCGLPDLGGHPAQPRQWGKIFCWWFFLYAASFLTHFCHRYFLTKALAFS